MGISSKLIVIIVKQPQRSLYEQAIISTSCLSNMWFGTASDAFRLQ